jgi:hypothetical protein
VSVVEWALPLLRETFGPQSEFTVDTPSWKRGWKAISQPVLDEAGVTVEGDVARVPCCDSDGSVLRVRFRARKRAWWGPGDGVHLFGLETLPRPGSWLPRSGALILAEGESDCLAAREHLRFHTDETAISYWVLGVPGARAFQSEWRIACEPFDVIYAVGDGDAAGRAFAFSTCEHVPWVRPVVCPEGRDLRDLLQHDGLDALLGLLREADALAEAECLFPHDTMEVAEP